MSGLTNTGFETETLSDVSTNITTSLKAEFGDSINTLPTSFFGQLTGIFAEQYSQLWELAQAVYNSQYPDTASGSSLDNVVALQGIKRFPPLQSTVTVIATGTNNTSIPGGTIFTVSGTGDKFQTLATAVIVGTSVAIPCASVAFDAIPAPAGTLTGISVALSGLTSVTNTADAVLGNTLESDAALRTRRQIRLITAQGGTLEAIRSKLLAVANVKNVLIFENNTQLPDLSGRPAKSYEVVVNGGADTDIDKVIWTTKPAGIRTVGTLSHTIVDSQGFTQPVQWSRPTVVPIYLTVTITANSLAPANLAALVLTEYLAYGNTLNMGDSVIVYPHLIAVVNSIPGILDVAIKVGTSPSPTSDANLYQVVNAVPTFDSSRTIVNVTVVP